MTDLTLTSPTFDDGGRINPEHGHNAANINPPLAIAGIPDEANSLALVVDDPDAREPTGQIWDHWVVWNVNPSRTEIPDGWSVENAMEGGNDFGETGWGGPAPPDGEHTYRFLLYALDDELSLEAGSTKDDLYDAIEGHVLEKTELDGTYAPLDD